jgi:hypothetical protein
MRRASRRDAGRRDLRDRRRTDVDHPDDERRAFELRRP